MTPPHLPCLIWSLVTCSAALAQRAPQWTIEELGAKSNNTTAHSINEHGLIAGRANHRAAAWLGGSSIELTPAHANAIASDAWDINADGVAVGSSFDLGTGDQVATLWVHRAGFTIGALPGGRDSFGHAINDQDVFVGTSSTIGHTTFHAFVGHLRELVDLHARLPWSGGESHAWDINEAGLIAGEATDPGGRAHAVLWHTDGTVEDLPTLGGGHASARGLNEAGDVVGAAETGTGRHHAFLSVVTKSGQRAIRDLGVLAGGSLAEGLDVNAQQEVVGWAQLPGPTGPIFVATYWSAAAGLVDLNASVAHADWHIQHAESINDRGDIVGYGWHFPTGDWRGFVLRRIALAR